MPRRPSRPRPTADVTVRHLVAAGGTGTDEAIVRTVLPGGLRVVSEHLPGSRSFAVGFFVATGSRHEAPQLHGVSHFLEHVLFKGTRRRDAEEISVAVEEVGGDLNAYTAKEHTCFHATVLAEDHGIAVDVLGDMLGSSLIRSRDVESERTVICDEIALHHDDPAEVADEMLSARLFAGTPLARSVIGTDVSVRGLRRRQIADYWRRHYRGPGIVVAAAGRVDHDQLVQAVAPFAELVSTDTGVPRLPSGGLGPIEPDLLVEPRPLERTQAALGFRSPGLFSAPGVLDESRYALNLLMAILGGGMSSRLFQEVRERRGLAYSIDAGEGAYADAGSVSIEWGSAPEKVPEILTLVRDEIARVIEFGVTDAELARARGQLTGQLLLADEGATARMSRIGAGELLGDRRSLLEVIHAYRQVTADDIRRSAADVLGNPPVLAVVGGRVSRPRLARILDNWP
jgi:predicted Zn-dependent peptidase